MLRGSYSAEHVADMDGLVSGYNDGAPLENFNQFEYQDGSYDGEEDDGGNPSEGMLDLRFALDSPQFGFREEAYRF